MKPILIVDDEPSENLKKMMVQFALYFWLVTLPVICLNDIKGFKQNKCAKLNVQRIRIKSGINNVKDIIWPVF